MLPTRETAVLTLKNLIFRSTGFVSLGDFLVEKYGLRKLEDVEHEISESGKTAQLDRKGIVLEEESKAPIILEEVDTKHTSHKIFEGNYLDSKIRVNVLGDVTRTEDLIEISDDKKYTVYTVEYQMVKFMSDSGYALQQLIEELGVDLGLDIESKNWSFHRGEEG